MIEVIEKLILDGTLHELMHKGLMSPKVLFYRNVYKDYLDNKGKNKNCKDCIMMSISQTAEKFKVTAITVIRAREAMERK